MNTAVIVGLGNPGLKYAKTRHNAGFMVIDNLIGKLKNRFEYKQYHNAEAWLGRVKGKPLMLVKPQVYMNNSGEVLAMFARKLRVQPQEFLVIYDDMDIELGKIRIRKKGGAGGHNGIRSIIAELKTENFPRLRIGIGRKEEDDQIDYVLGEFESAELEIFNNVLEISVDAIQMILYRGLGKAMNDFNGKETDKKVCNN
jgi:PTH1 family peptidyl-tRNA hydrolase